MRFGLAIASALFLTGASMAEIVTKAIDYKHGDTVLEGFLAYDDAAKGKRPGVLVVHEWWGISDFTRDKCMQLAREGYVAFALDMYGKGIRTTDREQAAKLSGQFKDDVNLLRARAKAGLDTLLTDERCDAKRVAAIGFCFGGTTVLNLALSGADLVGVVSYHGGIGPMKLADGQSLKAKILVLHGADDPFIPADAITAFHESMRAAKADWQMMYYGNAVHSFTNPGAKGEIPGAQYEARADKRSWEHTKVFFAEIFATK
ncbi:MAG: dienelactone hydrolase family protein [Phycisphaerales bacterium]|nr:dienelactone hydrolase family protein [Phycisphaerales bacterium]